MSIEEAKENVLSNSNIKILRDYSKDHALTELVKANLYESLCKIVAEDKSKVQEEELIIHGLKKQKYICDIAKAIKTEEKFQFTPEVMKVYEMGVKEVVASYDEY